MAVPAWGDTAYEAFLALAYGKGKLGPACTWPKFQDESVETQQLWEDAAKSIRDKYSKGE